VSAREPDALVSVVIPVHDGEKYLADAVRSALAQRYRPIEVLIIDDGSTDRSAEIATSFGAPVRVHRQANQGIGGALNTGVALARGELFAFLDGDDLWTEDKLDVQMAALASEPTLEAVLGQVVHFFGPELPAATRARIVLPPSTGPGHLHGALLIRRAAFARIGAFRMDLRVGQFVDWFARAREAGLRTRMLPDLVLRRRVHPGSMSLSDSSHRSDFARVARGALERRRARGSPP
jgi:glycosyltransferase involved in cell wall biosynthesis